MEEFNRIIRNIIVQLESVTYKGDLCDIGNEIGVVIGKTIVKDKMGDELDDFIAGVKHGVSLIDGTHG